MRTRLLFVNGHFCLGRTRSPAACFKGLTALGAWKVWAHDLEHWERAWPELLPGFGWL